MARARKAASTAGEDEEQRVDPRGLKKLSQDADNELGKKGNAITEKLGEKAAEGSLACAKLLVELAERRVVKRRVTRRKKAGPSMAERLGNQPEWSEPEEGGDEQPY